MKKIALGIFAVSAAALPAVAAQAQPVSADGAQAVSAPVVRSSHPAIDRLLSVTFNDPACGHDKSCFDRTYPKAYDRTTYTKTYDKTA